MKKNNLVNVPNESFSSFLKRDWLKCKGGVVFVVPITEVPGGDRLKLDQLVLTGLASGTELDLSFSETNAATFEIKSSFSLEERFDCPEPDWINASPSVDSSSSVSVVGTSDFSEPKNEITYFDHFRI